MEEYPKQQRNPRDSALDDLLTERQTVRKDSALDGLLAASLQERQAVRSAKRPWRWDYQFLIALFGGSLAIAVTAYVNGRRLGVKDSQQQKILLLGVLSVAATFIAAVVVSQFDIGETWQPGKSGFRLISRVIASIAYLLYYPLLKSGYRTYIFHYGDDFESLLQWGLVATFGLGFLQNILAAAIGLLLAG